MKNSVIMFVAGFAVGLVGIKILGLGLFSIITIGVFVSAGYTYRKEIKKWLKGQIK